MFELRSTGSKLVPLLATGCLYCGVHLTEGQPDPKADQMSSWPDIGIVLGHYMLSQGGTSELRSTGPKSLGHKMPLPQRSICLKCKKDIRKFEHTWGFGSCFTGLFYKRPVTKEEKDPKGRYAINTCSTKLPSSKLNLYMHSSLQKSNSYEIISEYLTTFYRQSGPTIHWHHRIMFLHPWEAYMVHPCENVLSDDVLTHLRCPDGVTSSPYDVVLSSTPLLTTLWCYPINLHISTIIVNNNYQGHDPLQKLVISSWPSKSLFNFTNNNI